jgi:hypothetical protein
VRSLFTEGSRTCCDHGSGKTVARSDNLRINSHRYDAGDLCPAAALPEFTAARIIVGHHDNDALDPDPAQTLQAFIHQTLTESASLISRINRQMINVSAASIMTA